MSQKELDTNVILSTYSLGKKKLFYPILTENTFDDSVPFNPDLGSGSMNTHRVSENISLLYINLKPEHDLLFEVVNQGGKLNFSFVLESADLPLFIDNINNLTIRGGENWLSGPTNYSAARLYGENPVTTFTVWVDPAMILDSLKNDNPDNIRLFEKIQDGDKGDSFVHTDLVDPEMRTIIIQILNCPYNHRLKNMFLEGKALELIALRLDQLFRNERARLSNKDLNPKDIDKMFYVRELLLKNISDPLSLSELAIKATTNTNKLKTMFKKVFGQSVFSFIREKRLEYARSLLLENDKNISEIAYVSGY
ncbi:MAG: AraC family transcriptional regulator [Spirochaetota bacterium]|nr:AraC family transcriptional regulator [Spirochaetota bacterium]